MTLQNPGDDDEEEDEDEDVGEPFEFSDGTSFNPMTPNSGPMTPGRFGSLPKHLRDKVKKEMKRKKAKKAMRDKLIEMHHLMEEVDVVSTEAKVEAFESLSEDHPDWDKAEDEIWFDIQMLRKKRGQHDGAVLWLEQRFDDTKRR